MKKISVKEHKKSLDRFKLRLFLLLFLSVSAGPFFIKINNAAAFVHPGILSTKEELDFIKSKVQIGAQPWKNAYDSLKANSFGSLNYVPRPRAVVECGYYNVPNYGCDDEMNDATAAYAHALLWYYSGNEAHAKKATEIMNAWSAVLTGHTNNNAKLQAGWVGSVFPRAAEIIRYTYSGWSAADVTRFSEMLRKAYLPSVMYQDCGYPQNWNLSFIEAMTHIAVFNNDQATFDKAMARWREWVPAAYYMKSDGSAPVKPAGCSSIGGYYGATTYMDGLCQETCRDLAHMQYGLAAMIYIAETASHQGVDLYGEQSNRITTSMEFHAQYINGAPVPSYLCGGTLEINRAAPTWEIAYNHYHNRLGLSLPNSAKLVANIRPTYKERHMSWETLTHAELGNVGTTPPTAPNTCTSFTYSSWSACQNNLQTRTLTAASPSGCTGGNPILSQSCSSSAVTYENHSITNQTGSFTVEFDAKPTQANSDVIVGLSNNAADAYTDLAPIFRFNPANKIDARKGSAYAADTALSYAPNTLYHVKMPINVSNRTYSVYVTPPGGAQTTIAQNYAFRSEQSNISNLNNWAKVTTAGGAEITNFTLSSATMTPQACGDGICNNGENSSTCSQDCSAPAPAYTLADFTNLVRDWLKSTTGSPADINADGKVNSRDLGIMMDNWAF